MSMRFTWVRNGADLILVGKNMKTHEQKLSKAKQLGIKLAEHTFPERTTMLERIKIRLECLRAIAGSRRRPRDGK